MNLEPVIVIGVLRAPNKKTTLAQGSGFRAEGVRPEPTAQNPEPERPEVILIGALSLSCCQLLNCPGGFPAASWCANHHLGSGHPMTTPAIDG